MLRARNGHPEPYGVKYWEIGNEIWGDWVRGHSDAATYARNLGRYIAAMRAVDPSIKVIAVGDNDMAWNRTVARATERFDYLAVHHYYSQRDMDGDLRNLVARPLHYERWYGELDTMLRDVVPGHRPQLAINEWGLDLPESQQSLDPLGALRGAADERVRAPERSGCHERRVGSRERLAGRHHPGGQPWHLRHPDLPGQQAVRDPPGHRATAVNRRRAIRLEHSRGSQRSRAGRGGEPFGRRPHHLHQGGQRRPRAIRDGTHHGEPRARGGSATLERVVADSMAAVNGFSTPDAVRSTRESIKVRNTFSLELPRHSVAVLTLTVEK